jgi:hypothetical protein
MLSMVRWRCSDFVLCSLSLSLSSGWRRMSRFRTLGLRRRRVSLAVDEVRVDAMEASSLMILTAGMLLSFLFLSFLYLRKIGVPTVRRGG